MNIAFAGFKHGHIGALYEEAKANPEINIIGAWEPTEEGRKLSEGLGIEFNYETLEDILKDTRVDTVVLGGYYGERGGHAIEALRAGKNVYTDKPLCTRICELDEIERLAREKNLKVGCMLTLRFGMGMKTVRDIIMNGDLGEIGAIDMTAQHPLSYGSRPHWYFESGKHGGTINDIAIHGIDIVRFVTGYGLKKVVAARTWNHFATEEPQFKDCGQFMVELENGAGFLGDVSYAAPAKSGMKLPFYWRIIFWGTKGVIEYKLNGESVEAAFVEDDFIKPIKAEKYDATCFGEFMKELRGEESIITTEDVFRTSRDALTMQAAAE